MPLEWSRFSSKGAEMSFSKFRHGTKFFALAAAVALSGTACASSTGPASKEDSATEAICNDTEGQVVWYTAAAPGAADQIVADFKAAHPNIALHDQRLTGTEATKRFSAESEAGVYAADVLTHVFPGWADDALSKGWIAPLDKMDMPAVKAYPDEFKAAAELTTSVAPANIMINTDAVSDPPKKWSDLLDPQYKGKIVMSDPRNIPAWIMLFNVFYEDPDLGVAFLQGIRDQHPIIVQSAVPGAGQVAAGEGASVVFPTMDIVTKPLVAKGAPVKAVDLSPTSGVETTTMISAHSPHPKAAGCFANWLATEAGQKAWNGGQRASSPLGDLEGTIPLPKDYKRGSWEAAQRNRPAILAALGLG
jgi:iron(III) transport system substrate-binding protein